MLGIQATVSKADGIVTAGNVLTGLIPITAALITLDKEDWDGLWQFTKSEGAAVIVAEGLKAAIPSTRPNGEDGSFPSVHTTVAVAGAQYLQSRYGWEYAAPAHVASAFVGYSRVYGDEHYWKDVAGGAAIGIASSYFFTDSFYGAKVAAVAVPGQIFVSMRSSW